MLNPRITEKGALLAEQGCYIFNIAPGASKSDVVAAVREVFKVTPRLVRVARVPRKVRMTRGTNRKGTSAAGKKAYVYLKKGETIELA